MKSPKLIGPAGRILSSLRKLGPCPVKLLFYGPPGVGKSEVARAVAKSLTHDVEIDKVNGRDCGVDVIRDWSIRCHGSSLFSPWRVFVIEELDAMSDGARINVLSFLDDLPEERAVICTTNHIEKLPERVRSRFERHEILAPTEEEIKALLIERKGVSEASAGMLAVTCAGNVRAALLDADALNRGGEEAHATYQGELLELLGV